jgi:hypothetical protein
MRQRWGSGGAGEAHMKSRLTDCHSSSTPLFSRVCAAYADFVTFLVRYSVPVRVAATGSSQRPLDLGGVLKLFHTTVPP